MGNIENAEKISRKFKNFFLQGTARRPEARPEGRGREEERKAPSYGNSFFLFIYHFLLMVIVIVMMIVVVVVMLLVEE